MTKKSKIYKGFSLIELLIAMFIFMMIILATVSTFASVVKTRKITRETQVNLENARSALEIWSKNTRMSRFVGIHSGALRMYNNSQNACIAYRFSGNNLEISQFTLPPLSDPNVACSQMTSYNAATWKILINNVSGRFYIINSSYVVPKRIGRATITIQIGKEKLQTSSSFREYNDLL